MTRKETVDPGEGWPGRDDFWEKKKRRAMLECVTRRDGEREERKQQPRLEMKGRQVERGPTGLKS